MIGRLCKFWNNESECYYGILCKIYQGAVYPYAMQGCEIGFKECRVLSVGELQKIQEEGTKNEKH